MAEDTTLQLIDRQQWLEPAAEKTQRTVTRIYEAAGETGRRTKNFLHGTWLGHPLHAAVTDVPLGAWTAAMVLDAAEEIGGGRQFRAGADAALAVGLVGAGAAALAGLADWSATDGRARKTGFIHGILNLGVAALYAGSWIARKRGDRETGRGLSALGFAVGMYSAYLGGKLVYEERIGVDHSRTQELPAGFTDVMADAELAEGELKRVDAGGARMLLARRDGRVYAIAEVCSHLGGPLSEGEFTGCTVRCPWHGSRFSLEDGRVLDGPAVHPQPALETRVRNGRIEVRAAG